MAHGVNSVLKGGCANKNGGECKTGIGSRRIFAPHFKLQVLDSYRNDADCKGNQRATARKYGIHRRQIQKWLQVENNLRNTVNNKAKSGDSSAAVIPEGRKCGGIELALRSVAHRQRDDFCPDAYSQSAPVVGCTSVAVEAALPRVPTISPVAYGPENATSTPLDFTTHGRGQNTVDPTAPMDLSLKKHVSTPSGETNTPVPCRLPPTPSSSPFALPSSTTTDPDVWDLSTRGGHKRKHSEEESISGSQSPNRNNASGQSTPKPVKLFKPYLDDLSESCQPKSEPPIPCCQNSPVYYPACESYYYHNNNNNNNNYQYTLHELQPKNSLYFYSVTQSYYQTQDCCSAYEDIHQSVPMLKQRQSYSLDFKLSAIECYHQDSICQGNQRAVANKFNIHRRQVQKWLQQEDELRQRHAVR